MQNLTFTEIVIYLSTHPASSIFVDGESSALPEMTLIEGGDGQNPIGIVCRKDYGLLEKLGWIKWNSYGGYKRRKVHDTDLQEFPSTRQLNKLIKRYKEEIKLFQKASKVNLEGITKRPDVCDAFYKAGFDFFWYCGKRRPYCTPTTYHLDAPKVLKNLNVWNVEIGGNFEWKKFRKDLAKTFKEQIERRLANIEKLEKLKEVHFSKAFITELLTSPNKGTRIAAEKLYKQQMKIA